MISIHCNSRPRYPIVVAEHPMILNQFAVGLTDGSVYVFEPLESDGQWGVPPPLQNGLAGRIVPSPPRSTRSTPRLIICNQEPIRLFAQFHIISEHLSNQMHMVIRVLLIAEVTGFGTMEEPQGKSISLQKPELPSKLEAGKLANQTGMWPLRPQFPSQKTIKLSNPFTFVGISSPIKFFVSKRSLDFCTDSALAREFGRAPEKQLPARSSIKRLGKPVKLRSIDPIRYCFEDSKIRCVELEHRPKLKGNGP
ncbi:hypothetical protein Ddye_026771 [Dipteronia dyeriana]|uniref:Uncharacterized protein n=1 Tax=Dipteronia dyeriana TaxID=168575 RepID=A0AAD9TNC5_9ROSI|nr:hypothetical protein Ddye_026771 [Dipteronia dyeriana]